EHGVLNVGAWEVHLEGQLFEQIFVFNRIVSFGRQDASAEAVQTFNKHERADTAEDHNVGERDYKIGAPQGAQDLDDAYPDLGPGQASKQQNAHQHPHGEQQKQIDPDSGNRQQDMHKGDSFSR